MIQVMGVAAIPSVRADLAIANVLTEPVRVPYPTLPFFTFLALAFALVSLAFSVFTFAFALFTFEPAVGILRLTSTLLILRINRLSFAAFVTLLSFSCRLSGFRFTDDFVIMIETAIRSGASASFHLLPARSVGLSSGASAPS